MLWVCATSVFGSEKTVFSVIYDVYWKGWCCGSMTSILTQMDDGRYRYKQSLESSLWIYSLYHQEESVFYKQSGLVPISYSSHKTGMEQDTYTIHFFKDYAVISRPSSQDERIEYGVVAGIHDKLTSQLSMILHMNQSPVDGEKELDFVDHRGWHKKTYNFYQENDKWCFYSDDGKKKNLFILDPNFKYLPVFFEQYRNNSLCFKGEMRKYLIGEAWDDFMDNNLLSDCER